MGIVNLKYKNILACILLLGIFLLGYNFRRWYVANHRIKKHISLIYSFAVNETGCLNFEKLVRQEFRKQGIEPVFDKFYLDCNKLTEKEEINHIRKYLELLKNKPIDLILPIGDQATYSMLSTRHQLLTSIPVVACNVNFPNEKLLKEYESRKIYVLRDTPDFRRNIEFIKALHPDTGMEIVFNVDLTFLGRASFDLLTRSVDRKNVRILGQQSMYALEDKYKEINDMVEYYDLMPALANERIKENEQTIYLYPFRYIKGLSLLVMMEKSKSEQDKKVFLLDKFDLVALPIVNALNIPSFSCIREGFGGESKIVGGYMATEEISARTAVDLSVRLMNKEKIGMPKIRDLEKEYILDWKRFSAYNSNDINKVPKHTRIINYPFYDHYRKELYLLAALFIFSFIFISISLLRIRRRSMIERKNMEMLEKVHKRLTLSTDGGQVSLWNMQGDVIEFDENYARLTGLHQRQFSRAEFSKFAHPDDWQLLSALYETLCQSTDTQIRRTRLCFDAEKKEYQWYELRCRSLKDAKGEMMLAGIMQNIQEVVDREQQLILAKQMAEKAELKQSFLNNISHEIRTPLNSIVGFTNVLVGEGSDEISPDEKASMLDIINRNNELLLKLINDMVEISHLDSGYMSFEIERWNMTGIVKEIYAIYQPLIQPSLQFHLKLDEALYLPVDIDRQRFIQVISNFLDNANKFTQEGYITLGCKVIEEQNEVCIYVEDSGKGIDEKEQIMIFDRFYKSDEFGQGSGLGLSISKVIIEKLSGRIEVRSKVGKGSCFSVFLSLAAQ
ncbi:HAMP domain-containing sensor histidine kinase [Bacteroides sp. GD17]|jgi:signal transduction histidine kinase|uniref:sensor histidine kinase n=1 Tax=Bacteroides sp. GD17 TaxID=3139826 RepID=UPI0025D745C3|nr:HAMP domain-containing sensor histidine kinase [uncultured Bacteroides sp.]